MGIYSEALERYLNAKWVELIAALFLWCVALILYLYLEHRRIRSARSRLDRAKKPADRAYEKRRHVKEKRRCGFYVSLFVLILASCLCSYLLDLIPAGHDQRDGTYVEFSGEITYEKQLGGILSFVVYRDAYGNQQRLEIPVVLRSRLLEPGTKPGTYHGKIVWGERSRIVVRFDPVDS